MPKPRGTTTQRGLGAEHQRRRRWLLDNHVDGSPCDECGQPMWLDQELDADHTVPRALRLNSRADRLLHARCNRSRGDGSRQAAATQERSKWTTLQWT